jgi:hypothetical protein
LARAVRTVHLERWGALLEQALVRPVRVMRLTPVQA